MQQVAQVTRHVTIPVANARTIKNKQYKRISPGCAATNLATATNASEARQRCTYMTGTMKLAINNHARTRTIITNAHAAIVDIKYTSCMCRKVPPLIIGSTNGSDSSAAKIKKAKPTSSEKRK